MVSTQLIFFSFKALLFYDSEYFSFVFRCLGTKLHIYRQDTQVNISEVLSRK